MGPAKLLVSLRIQPETAAPSGDFSVLAAFPQALVWQKNIEKRMADDIEQRKRQEFIRHPR